MESPPCLDDYYRIPRDWDILNKNLKYPEFQAAHILFHTLHKKEEADLSNDYVEEKWGRQKFQAILRDMKECGKWDTCFTFRSVTQYEKQRLIVALTAQLRRAFDLGGFFLIPDYYCIHILRHDTKCDTVGKRESEKLLKRFLCQIYLLLQGDSLFSGFQQQYTLQLSQLEACAISLTEASRAKRFLSDFPGQMNNFMECRREEQSWQIRAKEPPGPKPYLVSFKIPATSCQLPRKLHERKLNQDKVYLYWRVIELLADKCDMKKIYKKPNFLKAFNDISYLRELPKLITKILMIQDSQKIEEIKGICSISQKPPLASEADALLKHFPGNNEKNRVFLAHHYLHLAGNESLAEKIQPQTVSGGIPERALSYLLDDLGFSFKKELFIAKEKRNIGSTMTKTIPLIDGKKGSFKKTSTIMLLPFYSECLVCKDKVDLKISFCFKSRQLWQNEGRCTTIHKISWHQGIYNAEAVNPICDPVIFKAEEGFTEEPVEISFVVEGDIHKCIINVWAILIP